MNLFHSICVHLRSSAVLFVLFGTAFAAEPAQKACRSVHLAFPASAGTAFYNEVTVEQSADGTYFMVCGFRHGYFGIQQLDRGKKVLLFSVWDPGDQNDPESVKQADRVKLLHQGEGVRVGRFGGEGTGGQSFFDYDWKVGQTYRFCVTAERQDKRTAFAGYFHLPEKDQWKHLVTFSTLAGGTLLDGHYSFVEDFRRDGKSATQVRSARFGNGWVKNASGDWMPLSKARFTADDNPAVNIDAGLSERRFFLTTGGETKNVGTPLGKLIEFRELPTNRPNVPAGIEGQ
jgi:hypothetical protein